LKYLQIYRTAFWGAGDEPPQGDTRQLVDGIF
jgi:hypothetical protein